MILPIKTCWGAAALVTMLLAIPAAAQSVKAQSENIIKIVGANGCIMSASEFNAATSGMSEKNMEKGFKRLEDKNLAWFEGNKMVLNPSICPGKNHTIGRSKEGLRLLQIARENGCVLGEADGERLLKSNGFERRTVKKIVDSWAKEGIAVRHKDGIKLRVKGCA